MRAVFTLGFGLCLILVQSVILQLVPVHFPTPALGLLVVLHVGLSPRWTVFSSVLVGFSLGYLFDLVSATARGTHAFVYALVALIAALLGPRLSVRGFLLRSAAGLFVTLGGGFLVVLVRLLADGADLAGGFRLIPLESGLTAAIAPLVLGLLDRLDGRIDAARSPDRLVAGASKSNQTRLELP